MLSLYDLLGVPRDAAPAAIKAAYRELAGFLHPDRTGGRPAATRLFVLLNAAHKTLSDPRERALYDRQMAGHDRLLAARPARRFDWTALLDHADHLTDLYGKWRRDPLSVAPDALQYLQSIFGGKGGKG